MKEHVHTVPSLISISVTVLYFYSCVLHVILPLLQSVTFPAQCGYVHINTLCAFHKRRRLKAYHREEADISVCVVSAGSYDSYIISRLAVNLKFLVIHIAVFTKSCTVRTAFELPPENPAPSAVAEASSVYIV